jgi:prepilin-type N-terminal cleavage/methylation domain-containing protein
VRKMAGFTLIEMMVVVAILAILAAVAIPYYMEFRTKAKRAEAYVNLDAIRVHEEAYRADKGHYLTCDWNPNSYTPSASGTSDWDEASNFEVMGYRIQARHYYRYGVGGYSTGNSELPLPEPSDGVHAARDDSFDFAAIAEGDLDGDGRVSKLYLSDEPPGKVQRDPAGDDY